MKKSNSVKRRICTSLLSAMLLVSCCPRLTAHAEAPALKVVMSEKCTAEVNGNQITVTDQGDNNDVWNSKVLINTGVSLVPDAFYKISYTLTGDYGIGEFFLCKGENIDKRYDETFISEDGNRSFTIQAAGNGLYIGMQVGNLGTGNSVTAVIDAITPLEESENPALLQTANCTVVMEGDKLIATDTGENNDVWNSKILMDPGITLEVGKRYSLNLDLLGVSGVGEIFLCKSRDLNDRYDSTFMNSAGNRTVNFTAESEKVYIGMQFGNIGVGNSVSMKLGNIQPTAPKPEQPKVYPGHVTATVVDGVLVLNAVDTSPNNDVWDAKYIIDTGRKLIPGQKYEAAFKLDGDNGVGEFFLCKSANINDRYDASWTNAAGLKTVVFTAESEALYVGLQYGNLGQGNEMTAGLLTVQPYDEVTGGTVGPKTAQNCEYIIDTESGPAAKITVYDTNDNDDVWSSKILSYLGAILEKGRHYLANINLSGSNGVGEFFFLKSDNLDEPKDRYSYDYTEGDKTVRFQAADEKLYAAAQFGNIGNGNSAVYTIKEIYRVPGIQKKADRCEEVFGNDSVTLIDNDDATSEVFESKAIYDTGITLEPGKEYTVTYTLSGKGEFFLKSNDDLYNTSDVYEKVYPGNFEGDKSITFTATGEKLYFLVQCGAEGTGNKATVSNITVTPTGEAPVPIGLDGEDAITAAQQPEVPMDAPEVLAEPAAEEIVEIVEAAPAEEAVVQTEGSADAEQPAAEEQAEACEEAVPSETAE